MLRHIPTPLFPSNKVYNSSIPKGDRPWYTRANDKFVISQGGFTMKCVTCHNILQAGTGEFSMTINGKTVKVINAPILYCKNCNSVIISDEVKEKAKEFSEVYLYPDNTLDYAECEAGTVMPVMNLLF